MCRSTLADRGPRGLGPPMQVGLRAAGGASPVIAAPYQCASCTWLVCRRYIPIQCSKKLSPTLVVLCCCYFVPEKNLYPDVRTCRYPTWGLWSQGELGAAIEGTIQDLTMSIHDERKRSLNEQSVPGEQAVARSSNYSQYFSGRLTR
jgi:hypothetical protein